MRTSPGCGSGRGTSARRKCSAEPNAVKTIARMTLSSPPLPLAKRLCHPLLRQCPLVRAGDGELWLGGVRRVVACEHDAKPGDEDGGIRRQWCGGGVGIADKR